MARRRYTAEQIIGYLRQVEVMTGQGLTMGRSSVRYWGDGQQNRTIFEPTIETGMAALDAKQRCCLAPLRTHFG